MICLAIKIIFLIGYLGGALFYVSSPQQTTDPFSNTDTLGPGCLPIPSAGNRLECHQALRPILLDGVIGQEQGPPNVSTISAWSRSQSTVTVTFVISSIVQVRHIRLYFYNIPSMNIGLPEVTLIAGGLQEYLVIGNQNLSSTDNRRRNFILSYTNDMVMTNTFQIVFGFTRIDVDWLLLSEVEFCQSIDGGLSITGFYCFLAGVIKIGRVGFFAINTMKDKKWGTLSVRSATKQEYYMPISELLAD